MTVQQQPPAGDRARGGSHGWTGQQLWAAVLVVLALLAAACYVVRMTGEIAAIDALAGLVLAAVALVGIIGKGSRGKSQ